jgi:DNA-binding NarL/FixJ family response regulator
MIDIALLDNRPIYTNGIKQIIMLTPGNRVVGTFSTFESLYDTLKKYHIDILILDHTNQIITLDELKRINSEFKELKIIDITKKQPKAKIIEALKNGVTSYLMDDCDALEINDAIKQTYKGNQFFCSKVMDILTYDNENTDDDNVELSLREIEIIQLIAKGLTNKQIADKLCLSAHTINTHRKNIMKKLGIKNTAGIVIYAFEENLLE